MAKHRSKPAGPVGPGSAQRFAVAALCVLAAVGSVANAQTVDDDGSDTTSDVQTAPSGSPVGDPAAIAATTIMEPGSTVPTSAPALPPVDDAANDEKLQETLLLQELRRQNQRERTVDDVKTASTPKTDDDGIAIGTMRLRTSLSQSYGYEQQKTNTDNRKRNYLETELKGTLTSDWSLHQLTITGDGVWQKNLNGELEEDPTASLDAELRLDLSNDTTVTLKAGYDFQREDANDPNAITGATAQSGVHTFSTGIEASHDIGILRGTAGLDLSRSIYTAAKLADGTSLSQSDRNADTVTGTARLGYELSPALIPFLEASAGRTFYDKTEDSEGYKRSYNTYSAVAGVEFDGGEKLSGELAAGYEFSDFDDDRLDTISGLKVEGKLLWSPMRGTTLATTLTTKVEPSSSGAVSGSTLYTMNNTLSREIRDDLVARLTGNTTFRAYPSDSTGTNQFIWSVGGGLTWSLSRYLELGGDVTYQYTDNQTGSDVEDLTAKIGLTLKR
ncbi:outer membrane beta-barrel protein [Rhizobium sp. PAMB 3174]